MKNWQKVFSTQDNFKAELILGALQQAGLSPILINKKDTAFNNFGEVEVHVEELELEPALKVIENEIDFK